MADAQLELEKYNIQEKIDDLTKVNDEYNKAIEDTIELLDKQSEKWSEIASKIEQAQNELKANDVLGDGWKELVINGTDEDIFNAFKNIYSTNAEQILKYEEQIESTENIYNLLQQYVDAYRDGTISYELAQSGISGLLSQMNDKMSAMDNLNNIYDYMGSALGTSTDADSILGGIQSSLKEEADNMIKNLAQYQSNLGLISEYTTSWEQLTNNVSSMVDILKDVRDALENANDHYDDWDDDSDSGYIKTSSNTQNYGPGYDENGVAWADGIQKGLTPGGSKEMEKVMQQLGLKPISDDGFWQIVHPGEAIFNPEQQEQLLKNFRSALTYSPIHNLIPAITKPSSGNVIEINMGNLELPNVTNVEEFAEQFSSVVTSKLTQNFSKIFNK